MKTILFAGSVALLLLEGSAFAWDSSCQTAEVIECPVGAADGCQEAPETNRVLVPCPEGPGKARIAWTAADGRDEHRRLFELALDLTTLPTELKTKLRTPQEFVTFSAHPSALLPAPFEEVQRVLRHARTVAEFAQLPDYGYTLGDWATGFNTCPPSESDNVLECHEFASHMGPLNSSHWPPQSRVFYVTYHELALLRADACRHLTERLGAQAERFAPLVDACVREAFALEAIGQHYLQDMWSMGHMWERWGSPELFDFPGQYHANKLETAWLVSVAAGLIHGTAALTWPLQDAMCSPDDEVEFVLDGSIHRAIGDLYLPQLLAEPQYNPQRSALFGCSKKSLEHVYGALSGVPGGRSADDCFEPRATNRALRAGLGPMNFDKIRLVLRAFASIPGWPRTVGRAAESVVLGVYPELQHALTDLHERLWAAEQRSPLGTDMARGGIGPILGVGVNSSYAATNSRILNEERNYPWPAEPNSTPLEDGVIVGGPRDRRAAIPRVFHQAHAVEWCDRLNRDDLYDLRERARGKATDDPAVVLCAELARRHLQVVSPPRPDPTGLPPELVVLIDALANANPSRCEPGVIATPSTPGPVALPPPAALPPPPPPAAVPPERASFCSLAAPNSARLDYQVPAGEERAATIDDAIAWCTRPDCNACPPETTIEITEFSVTPDYIGPATSFAVQWALNVRSDVSVATVDFHVSPTEELVAGFSGLTRVFRDASPFTPGPATQTQGARNCLRFDETTGAPYALICGASAFTPPTVALDQPAYGVLDVCVGCLGTSAQVCDRAAVPLILSSN